MMDWFKGDNTITIINKLSAKDSPRKTDEWFSTTLSGCVWDTKVNREVTETNTNITQSTLIRIEQNDLYRPYNEWRKEPKKYFTANVGDFVVLGNVDISKININYLKETYKANCIQIKAFKDNTNTIILPHYKIEGV